MSDISEVLMANVQSISQVAQYLSQLVHMGILFTFTVYFDCARIFAWLNTFGVSFYLAEGGGKISASKLVLHFQKNPFLIKKKERKI